MEAKETKEAAQPQTPHDVIPAPIRALITLFEGPLREVRFPDVDGGALQDLVAQAEAQVAEVMEAEQLLATARRTLEDKLDQLNQKAHRALSYAKVYAEDDLPLRAEIANILLPKQRRGAVGAPTGAAGQGTKTTPVPGAVAMTDGSSPDNEGSPAPTKRRGRPRKTEATGAETPVAAAPVVDVAAAEGASGLQGAGAANVHHGANGAAQIDA